MNNTKQKKAKPFVKWAGGKTQLLPEIARKIPFSYDDEFTYIEPFVGSGAVFFYILKNYPRIKNIVINDNNSELILTFNTIKYNINELIDILVKWENEYHKLETNSKLKKEYYYEKREKYNNKPKKNVVMAALFIFLNRTCFNGLYRVNSKNKFNVPIGSYKKPMICDQENLLNINRSIQNVEILNGDFEETFQYATEKTIFYFDPPYRPLSLTSSFNSYQKTAFNDKEQIRLKNYCDKIHQAGYNWLLSNSDPKNTNHNDDFFDNLYQDYKIERIMAKRSINSKGNGRNSIYELLIKNY